MPQLGYNGTVATRLHEQTKFFLESPATVSQSELQFIEKIRREMHESYAQKRERLQQQLERNRQHQDATAETLASRDRLKVPSRRIAVVVSLWEGSSEQKTVPIFLKTVASLLQQSAGADAALDIFIVANNGGGKTAEIGTEFVRLLESGLRMNHPEVPFVRQHFVRPAESGDSATTPSELEESSFFSEFAPVTKNNNRFFLYTQEHVPANQGKIRALRDVVPLLDRLIMERRYAPDAVLQIDAESIFEMPAKTQALIAAGDMNPLTVLLHELFVNKKVAVGTKDRFVIMEDAEVSDYPVGPMQVGYEAFNEKHFISLPGGGLLILPAEYLAGLDTIARFMPGIGTEDYALTKLLQADMGPDFLKKVSSPSFVRHQNRAPIKPEEALSQMVNWRKQSAMIDRVMGGVIYGKFHRASKNRWVLLCAGGSMPIFVPGILFICGK